MKFAKVMAYITITLYLLGAFVTADFNFLNWSVEARAVLAMVWSVCIITMPMFTALTGVL